MTTPMTAEAQERAERTYEDLYRWIRKVASAKQIAFHWAMSGDDIICESYFVICKVSKVYLAKPYPEHLILCKASIHNWIGSMRYRYCLTHRGTELKALPLDSSYMPSEYGTGQEQETFGDMLDLSHITNAFCDDAFARGMSPEHYVETAEKYLEISSKLSKLDLAVLNALLGDDERVLAQVKLSAARKTFVYNNPTVVITPLIIARAMGESETVVAQSFKRIRSML